MRVFDASLGPPADGEHMPTLYFLGVGGPEDAAGLGDVQSFVWRFVTLERAGEQPTVLAFTVMPKLIAVTRTVNGQRANTLSTEALTVDPRTLRPTPVTVVVDPEASEVLDLAAGSTVFERRLPTLEGPAPA
jgi:hypothetical protein